MLNKLKFWMPILALPISALLGSIRRKKYTGVHTFCCFIGYSRSGHTLVGSLLDAHPNIVISTEADAFNLVKLGYGRNALLYYLEIWSKLISRLLGNKWTGYDYGVKDANQGGSQSISVIGDKKGNRSLTIISRNPKLPGQLRNVVKVPVKYIHVIRNPFDIISTMHNRDEAIENISKTAEVSNDLKFSRKVLKKSIRSCFNKVKRVQNLIEKNEMEILNVYHEELISSPEETLKTIFSFLGVASNNDFLKQCAETVFKSPNKSRHTISWPGKLKIQVQERCDQVPFLKNYSFDK